MKLTDLVIPPWVKPAACALALGVAFYGGWKVQGWRCSAAKTHALEQAQKQFDKQLAQANRAAADYEQSRARGQAESRQRETRVRGIYRERQVPASCEPGPDALRVLDSALDQAGAAAPEPRAAVPGPAAASQAVPRS